MKRILLICSLFVGIAVACHAQTTSANDPAQKAKGLQKQLKLTDAQTAKVSAIYQESANKFEKIKTQDHGNTDKMLADVGPLRTSTIKKIKAILTPDQAVKYDKLVTDSKNATLNGGWSDGWSSSAAK
ncbi:Spy/CpxP family protein refolding chaperone [Mucilaginibacter sp. X4EP1]|jgi:periplasmic protein CpxP/Spy|uniref:Spy/CpxP family protein refolding chaperone n=1 Tax=Mucilaginibacter sp. X4EP1 TaxID=2723092 RepID=UPI002168212D|nr:hypothetical protein [Mucilaginibacter sp. X4EP1]MCS3816373.1 Spy/CpxP family protein refolding chaperone [Mucilaginibacter sp. X4EP1]